MNEAKDRAHAPGLFSRAIVRPASRARHDLPVEPFHQDRLATSDHGRFPMELSEYVSGQCQTQRSPYRLFLGFSR